MKSGSKSLRSVRKKTTAKKKRAVKSVKKLTAKKKIQKAVPKKTVKKTAAKKKALSKAKKRKTTVKPVKKKSAIKKPLATKPSVTIAAETLVSVTGTTVVEEIAIAPPPGLLIGKVTHYYNHSSVAIIELDAGTLHVGDTIHIKGHTTDFAQELESIQINEKNVETAEPGEPIGLKVREVVREHDKVYKKE